MLPLTATRVRDDRADLNGGQADSRERCQQGQDPGRPRHDDADGSGNLANWWTPADRAEFGRQHRHTRGSLELLETSLKKLGIESFREDEANSVTTPDRFASIRTVACFGQCALAPVVQIDGAILSRMTVGKLTSAIDKLRKGGSK